VTAVRVRFAPSPTGELHIGSVRTTLYNYLFAKQHSGALILRIEDTDQDRLVPTALDSVYDGLTWLGIRWDEGPREGGPHKPYIQSERLPIYREHARGLVNSGWGYPCFCTKERLAEMREQQLAAKQPVTRYDRRCRAIARHQAETRVRAGEEHTIRLKVPEEGEIGARDLIHGEVKWHLKDIEDAILLKSDGFPTYHLAVVIDDHTMGITHVLRGDEWLPSLPKHLLLFKAFGWDPPPFGHLPTVLGPDRKKLSKRHGATAVSEFREQGYLPEALVNFLALIGWSPGTEEEVFTVEELVTRWRLDQVQDSPGIWDRERLKYFNGVHIRKMPQEELARRIKPFLPKSADDETVARAIPLIQTRIQTLVEARDLLAFLFTDELEYAPEQLVGKKRSAEETRNALVAAAAALSELGTFTNDEVETRLRQLAESLGWKAGDLFLSMRVAITGRTVTPPLAQSIVLLGQERAVARLRDAANRLRDPAPV
jgi:glutamyl-tRNA synthetase